jgi:phytoene dehydrogenase-like protein
MIETDVVVVGSGAAGLTAAAYIAKAGYKVSVFEKDEAFGGLLGSFLWHGHQVDKGARGIIDSGIVFPMLKQLGITMQFTKNPIRILIADQGINLNDDTDLMNYQRMLIRLFPQEENAIVKIMQDIRIVMKQMDVIYGIENPLFLPKPYDMKYLGKTLLPWMGKFIINIRRAMKRMEPIETYLRKYTSNQRLIDMIAQHFFAQTPAFFALSYFTLYKQYHYPMGSTQSLIDSLVDVITKHGGSLINKCEIRRIDPQTNVLTTCHGEEVHYKQMVWAGDTNTFYATLDLSTLKDESIKSRVLSRQTELKGMRGADSILSLYVVVSQEPQSFATSSGPHAFYTPELQGISSVSLNEVRDADGQWTNDADRLWTYLEKLMEANTFEISIPSLRDATLSAQGQTALILSTLFDYGLCEHIAKLGLLPQFKERMTETMLRVMEPLWPNIRSFVLHTNIATPLTIKNRTNAHEGSVTGWSFSNHPFPAETQFLRVSQAVKTPIDTIKQAGQWTFNPAGVPVAIMTGKLAADAVLKDLNKRKKP